MTDAQLDAIEADLGFRLPADYRRVSLAFPFRPIGRDWVYWFYDDPAGVINNTRYPHEDGDYAGPKLPPRYVAIGESAAGDAYLLDTADAALPVACLSHETHAIEPEWPTFAAFVDEWLRAPAEIGPGSDPGFGGEPGAVRAPTALAVDSAGRVLFSRGSGDGLTVGRLTADGKTDTGFGVGGQATTPPMPGAAGSDSVSAIAAQPDGGVVVVGSLNYSGAAAGGSAIAVGRLTANGVPDASFGAGGGTIIDFPAGGQDISDASAVALQPDGRIVVAGSAVVGLTGGRFSGYTEDSAFVRLTAAGQLDPTFGTGGRATIPTAGSDQAADVRVLGDGRIMAIGVATIMTTATSFGPPVRPYAARLAANGTLDTTYGVNGLANVGVRSATGSLADTGATVVLPDGRVVDATPSATVQRLTADGKPDPSFSTAQPPAGFSGGVGFPTGDGGAVFFSTSSNGAANPASAVVFRVVGTTSVFPTSAGTLALGGMPNGSFTPLVPDAAGGTPTPAAPVTVYPGFSGTVRTATADVTGDGVPDIVTGPGPGGGPNVVVTDGKTGAVVASFMAFETSFTGGVFVAVADLNGDGRAEVVVTPDQGGGPVVAIFDGAGRNASAELTRFFGIDDPSFRGGARPALGDVSGDGVPDLVVAAGVGGGPRVAAYDGSAVYDPSRYVTQIVGQQAVLPGGDTNNYPPQNFYNLYASFLPKLIGDFFVFEPTLRNGVFVAAGDLNGDGKAEVVGGGGPGGGPRVTALDGAALLAGGQQVPVVNFFAGDPSGRGGVRVAVRPSGADGLPRLFTGSGDGEAGRVNVYRAATARSGGAADQTLAPFGDGALADGVYVG